MVLFLVNFRCLELEILLSTYSGSSVQALKKIRSHLKASITAAEADIERTRASLVQYEAVGEEFGSVVKDYAKVKEEIKGTRWALKELKENAGGGGEKKECDGDLPL